MEITFMPTVRDWQPQSHKLHIF